MITEKISIKKRLILEATLKVMFEGFYEDANINSISRYVKLDAEKIKQYYDTDDKLRMSAMKYAAVLWVEQIKADVEKQKTEKDKIYVLIKHYISGSESHSQSLSLYIDAWKKLRDLKTENRQLLSNELLSVYRYYVNFFQETIKNIYENKYGYDIEQLAWIMVVVSDGFHIQSLIQPEKLDFDRLTHVFCKMLQI